VSANPAARHCAGPATLAPPAPLPEVVDAALLVAADVVDVAVWTAGALVETVVLVLGWEEAAAGWALPELDGELEPPQPPSRAAAPSVRAMNLVRMLIEMFVSCPVRSCPGVVAGLRRPGEAHGSIQT
jgi:hypothetical protein